DAPCAAALRAVAGEAQVAELCLGQELGQSDGPQRQRWAGALSSGLLRPVRCSRERQSGGTGRKFLEREAVPAIILVEVADQRVHSVGHLRIDEDVEVV